ncbi:hypothetical protein BDZ94DRAFT_1245094 [Collybia nuda]|uniref:Uncharacterized protein n=1 Tax=Collybia nuda TaxID=64659 RepID=A0A9P6CJY2_9AGAR|nr:hypothetical protein BDZ94DRAFT_1245094 [Collybia nuda]
MRPVSLHGAPLVWVIGFVYISLVRPSGLPDLLFPPNDYSVPSNTHPVFYCYLNLSGANSQIEPLNVVIMGFDLDHNLAMRKISVLLSST